MTAGRKDDSGDHNEREYDQGYSTAYLQRTSSLLYKYYDILKCISRIELGKALSENA